MSEQKDGGPAFPVSVEMMGYIGGQGGGGMSLRDYFAAAAMQGMMARIGGHDAYLISHDAYIVADAMLKERSK